MRVLVSLTIRLSAAIRVLHLSGLYSVGQDVLIQNFYEQRICPVCKGWTEAFYEVPLNTFLRDGDNSFPLPPRHGGGIIMEDYREPFCCLEMAYKFWGNSKMKDIPVQWQQILSTTTDIILPLPGSGSFSDEVRVQAWECIELLPNSVPAYVLLD